MAKVMVVDDSPILRGAGHQVVTLIDGDALERRQGADDYLGKPFTSDQLLGMVGRFAR